MSSRNRYLDPAQRELATVLSAALAAGRHAAGLGPDAVLSAARAVLDSAMNIPGVAVDYLELRAADLSPLAVPDVATVVGQAAAGTDGDAPAWSSNARLLIAARIGATRLIDNVPLSIGHSPDGHPAAPVSAAAPS
jgi:pantoate--beta-alanine ligase